MSKMLRFRKGVLFLSALLAAGATQAKQNFSMDSPNQPVVTGGKASVPNCPNFGSSGLDSAAVTDANYGCAINSNLAAMIADPTDLIHGKSDDATDTRSALRAIKAWHEAEPTSKLWTTTTKESAKGGGQ